MIKKIKGHNASRISAWGCDLHWNGRYHLIVYNSYKFNMNAIILLPIAFVNRNDASLLKRLGEKGFGNQAYWIRDSYTE